MSLTTQESRQIEQLLSQDGHVLAMTAARLYQSSQREYTYFLTGVVTLHRSSRGAFSFKIVDLKTNRAVWEFPIVGDIKYLEDKPFFHSFVGQNCMMGLSFADDDEAKLFADWYKSRDNFVPPAPLAARNDSYQQNSKSNNSVSTKESATVVKEVSAPSSSSKKESSSGGGLFGFGRKNSDKAKPKFDKSMISAPSNFEHVSHVGFSAQSGFSVDNIPMEWKLIFQKAGITDEQLQDKKQRKVVKQFMKDNAGLVGAPPAIQPQPGQTSPGMSRRAPPPPPSKRAPPPAPNRASVNARQDTYQQAPPPQQEPVRAQKMAPNPPARRLSNAQQPSYQAAPQIPTRGPPERVVPSIPDRGPPVERYAPSVPSSRPPAVPSGGPPPPPPMMVSSGPPPPPTAPRAQQQAAPPKGKPTDLLSQIQQGTKLKSVQPAEEDAGVTSPKTGDDLADALKAALGNRLLAVAGSDSDGESDDSEW